MLIEFKQSLQLRSTLKHQTFCILKKPYPAVPTMWLDLLTLQLCRRWQVLTASVCKHVDKNTEHILHACIHFTATLAAVVLHRNWKITILSAIRSNPTDACEAPRTQELWSAVSRLLKMK